MAKWIEENTRKASTIFVCSECKGRAYFNHGNNTRNKNSNKYCGYNYCPNCGNIMQE